MSGGKMAGNMSMNTFKRTSQDISIACGIIALLVFAHISMSGGSANASPAGRLLMQGTGVAYGGLPVDERLGAMEDQARKMLMQLGASQISYSSSHPRGCYAYLHDLMLAGELQPNASGRTLVNGYSIGFYLPQAKTGFTLLASPTQLQLRPLMLDENQEVVTLTPTIEGDPDRGWANIRERLRASLYQYGYYMHPMTLETIAHDPPLQARINWSGTEYVLVSLRESPESGFTPDPSLIFSSFLNTYLVGAVHGRD